jgi:hypothetical protein
VNTGIRSNLAAGTTRFLLLISLGRGSHIVV